MSEGLESLHLVVPLCCPFSPTLVAECVWTISEYDSPRIWIIYNHLGIWTISEYGPSRNLGIWTISEYGPSRNMDHLGIWTISKYGPSRNMDHLGIWTISEYEPSQNIVHFEYGPTPEQRHSHNIDHLKIRTISEYGPSGNVAHNVFHHVWASHISWCPFTILCA